MLTYTLSDIFYGAAFAVLEAQDKTLDVFTGCDPGFRVGVGSGATEPLSIDDQMSYLEELARIAGLMEDFRLVADVLECPDCHNSWSACTCPE